MMLGDNSPDITGHYVWPRWRGICRLIKSQPAGLLSSISSADGCPYPREEIWETIAAQLNEDCWGKLPQEALAGDLAALRKGGIRIAYSRRPEIAGYYLQHPRLERPSTSPYKTTRWKLIEAISELSVPEKNERTLAAAEFALRQKKLILAEEHPDWPETRVEKEARHLVFGEAKVAQ